MAQIPRLRQGELVRKVFEILIAHPEGLAAKDVLRQVEQALPLTDYERSDYPNRPGIRRFEKIVRFSTIAPVKAGWMVKEKGSWKITEEGRSAFARLKDPEEFQREAGRLYREWAGRQIPEEEDEAVPEGGPVEATTTLEEAEEEAWRSLENYIPTLNPYDFQKLVAALLRGMGYHVAWVAPPGPDRGVDILAYNDPLGTKMPRIKVQVKRRQDKIPVEEIRSFMSVLGDQDVGLFVATGGFTSDAQTTARMKESQQITLLGLEELFDLWVEHYDKIKEEDKRLLPLKPIYYLDLRQ